MCSPVTESSRPSRHTRSTGSAVGIAYGCTRISSAGAGSAIARCPGHAAKPAIASYAALRRSYYVLQGVICRVVNDNAAAIAAAGTVSPGAACSGVSAVASGACITAISDYSTAGYSIAPALSIAPIAAVTSISTCSAWPAITARGVESKSLACSVRNRAIDGSSVSSGCRAISVFTSGSRCCLTALAVFTTLRCGSCKSVGTTSKKTAPVNRRRRIGTV